MLLAQTAFPTCRCDSAELRVLAKRGDEAVERRVSEQLGDDGDDILTVLHGIEGGVPYYRLIAAAREAPLDSRQLSAVRAAYNAYQEHLLRRRAQGGRP